MTIRNGRESDKNFILSILMLLTLEHGSVAANGNPGSDLAK